MSNQFLHIGLYGPEARKGQPPWSTIAGIVQEGARAPGAARHVAYPTVPTLLYGLSPIEVGRIALERAEQARDAIGRRLRRDGAVLVAGVLSYPVKRDLVEDRDAPDARDLYTAWRAEAVAWCHGQFGDTLLSIVEHHDEEYLHLHAYAVPILGPGRRLVLEAIHPGRAAVKRAQAGGEDKKGQQAAYLGAMKRLQDEFHASVSVRYGHARLGPRRRRLDRTEHLLRREARRREVELERAYAEETVQVRSEIEAEVLRRFGAALTESRRRSAALVEARDSDRHRIDALNAECARLRAELASRDADSGSGYGR
ncbi:hypothetical protein CIW48_22400 [Methylobacterium sp. P1-11]|uniref:hypothetical protein n=1 Tax=Methylobacterium sp. P1-11 TaxID=2024616 RepID=UPI0011EF1C09|nr:hypothetical protein [Methylobacterium sp. P1-11]KAA0121720.1 hypothetical protein CIW48_22400 [Methylobacterium sp. P1-11]